MKIKLNTILYLHFGYKNEILQIHKMIVKIKKYYVIILCKPSVSYNKLLD